MLSTGRNARLIGHTRESCCTEGVYRGTTSTPAVAFNRYIPHRQTSGLLQPHHRQGCRKEQTMFRRILVPLDGSELAERAIPVAARIARASGGGPVFLRVILPPPRVRAHFVGQKQFFFF